MRFVLPALPMKKTSAALLALGMTGLIAACATPQSGEANITILAINDFHGNLNPQNFRLPNQDDPSKTTTISAGGIEALGAKVAEVRAANPNTIFVGGGDLIGASPIVSSLLRDEPSIDALGKMGMEVSVVGNHEFDQGRDELLRLQNGGCNSNAPDKACKYANPHPGAKFKYLAANVIDTATGKPFLPPYYVRQIDGVKIGFVGATLSDAPTIVNPNGIVGLKFIDEAEAINAAAKELKAQGVNTVIALVHQGQEGGMPPSTLDKTNCSKFAGPIVEIAKKLDPAVVAVVSGHTHSYYQCKVDGKLVTQADYGARLLTEIKLKVARANGATVQISSSNIALDNAKLGKDPLQTAVLKQAKALTDPAANQPVATLSVTQISRNFAPSGESDLGNVIADSQLADTAAPARGGAQIALMNPGGVRAHLPANPSASKQITYGDIFTVQPFGNTLVVIDLTGAQIKKVLEQQWSSGANVTAPKVLQVSKGFSYSWDASRPLGDRVVPGSIKLNGAPLVDAQTYRVTVNDFLAGGGDNFTELKNGKNRLGASVDVEAFNNYLKAHAPVAPSAEKRITRLN